MKALTRMWLLCMAAVIAVAGSSVYAHGDEPHGKASAVQAPIAEEEEGRLPLREKVSEDADTPLAQASHSPVATLTMLHPATVHFPIALLLVAAALEALSIIRPQLNVERTIKTILYFAAAGTVIAALFGWIHTGMWMGGEVLMQRHRWVGTGLAMFSIVLAWLASRPIGRARGALRAGLAVCAIAVILQGYWGAELSHGPYHLSQGH